MRAQHDDGGVGFCALEATDQIRRGVEPNREACLFEATFQPRAPIQE
jgi:hypothetical protein